MIFPIMLTWKSQNVAGYIMFKNVQSCPATMRLVITLIGCNAVGRASRFFRPLGFLFYLIFLI